MENDQSPAPWKAESINLGEYWAIAVRRRRAVVVSLVIAVEQAIEERYDLSIGLADEKALSQKNSPYRTVRTLADYAAGEIAGQGAS